MEAKEVLDKYDEWSYCLYDSEATDYRLLDGVFKEFLNNRWLVFMASMWVQSCSGIGYLFGSLSPVIKKSMGYNQRQLAMLGVAKDLGDAIGFIGGSLCEVLSIWAVLTIGVVQNFVGYGLVWIIVSCIFPASPLWLLYVLIFVGTNGETYFNTGALVVCVQNFPKNCGPVVGILKGFAGLSGEIMTQVYLMFNFLDETSLILTIAISPTIVITVAMFLVKPVRVHRQVRDSDNSSFLFVYGVCLILQEKKNGLTKCFCFGRGFITGSSLAAWTVFFYVFS